jgi:hypothetical protein
VRLAHYHPGRVVWLVFNVMMALLLSLLGIFETLQTVLSVYSMVALAWVSLAQKPDPLSPFPRWIGYFTIWGALMFELGAIAFLPKTGPFAWNGLFVFWFPFCIFGTWISVLAWSLLRAIKRQEASAG